MDETIAEIPPEHEVFVIRITGDRWDQFVGQRIADIRTGRSTEHGEGKFIEFRFDDGSMATIHVIGEVLEVTEA